MIKPWNLTDRELILAGLESGEVARELALRLEELLYDAINSLDAELASAKTKIDELVGELETAQYDLAEAKRKTKRGRK